MWPLCGLMRYMSRPPQQGKIPRPGEFQGLARTGTQASRLHSPCSDLFPRSLSSKMLELFKPKRKKKKKSHFCNLSNCSFSCMFPLQQSSIQSDTHLILMFGQTTSGFIMGSGTWQSPARVQALPSFLILRKAPSPRLLPLSSNLSPPASGFLVVFQNISL